MEVQSQIRRKHSSHWTRYFRLFIGMWAITGIFALLILHDGHFRSGLKLLWWDRSPRWDSFLSPWFFHQEVPSQYSLSLTKRSVIREMNQSWCLLALINENIGSHHKIFKRDQKHIAWGVCCVLRIDDLLPIWVLEVNRLPSNLHSNSVSHTPWTSHTGW